MTISSGAENLRRATLLALVVGLLLSVAVGRPAWAATVTTTFTPTSDDIANPERGFYHQHQCGSTPLVQKKLEDYRTLEKRTLILCIFSLRQALTENRALTQAELALFDRQAATVKAAGVKMIVRFSYTDGQLVNGQTEPDLPLVRRHISDLTPFFVKNQAVIAVVQAGFIGKYGEQATSTHFGNDGSLSAQNRADREEVVRALLTAVPGNRMIQLRTPQKKQMIFGPASLSSAAAYRGSAAARVGHHNDCFLSNATDSGTYLAPGDHDYVVEETAFLPMGGETCFRAESPPEARQKCTGPDGTPNAQTELRDLHWSYLNRDYDSRVLDQWSAGHCMDLIVRSLGYRFSLVDASLPSAAVRGGSLPVRFRIDNLGYATPFNERLTYLVLRHATSGQTVRLKINTDPRRWSAGPRTTVSQTLTVPASLATGTYSAALQISDGASALSTVPAYCIQLANAGVWDASTGVNQLGLSVAVT